MTVYGSMFSAYAQCRFNALLNDVGEDSRITLLVMERLALLALQWMKGEEIKVLELNERIDDVYKFMSIHDSYKAKKDSQTDCKYITNKPHEILLLLTTQVIGQISSI